MCIRDRIDPVSVSICEESKIGVELTNTSNLDISNFKFSIQSVSYTHLTLPTSDLV